MEHHGALPPVLSVLQGQLDGHQFCLQGGAVVGSPLTHLGPSGDGSSPRPSAVRVSRAVGVVHSTVWLGDLRHGHEGVLPHLLHGAERLAGGQLCGRELCRGWLPRGGGARKVGARRSACGQFSMRARLREASVHCSSHGLRRRDSSNRKVVSFIFSQLLRNVGNKTKSNDDNKEA